ncbi:hypothetical protein Tco_0528092 [Tanacetum coccineum]
MREEQNQPGVMQELLLKLMDDLQILKGSQQEKKETFSRIPFGVKPKVILIAWESFGEIKDALMDKQYRQEDIQELMSKLLEDVRNISEEFSEYINCPSWNRPLFYFDDDDDEYTVIWRRPKVITPDEPSEEPEDPLIMGEKELSTIPEKDKSSVEDLVPIPSGSKGVSDDIYDHSDAESLLSQDIPITSPKIDFLSEEFTAGGDDDDETMMMMKMKCSEKGGARSFVFRSSLSVIDEVFRLRKQPLPDADLTYHQSPGFAEPAAVVIQPDQDPSLLYRVAIPSPPLPIPPPSPISPTYVEGSLGSRAAGIRQRDALPNARWGVVAAGAARQFGPTTAEADLYGFTDMLEAAPGRQMSRELGYGIRDTWDDLVGAIQEIAPTTLEGVNQRVIELSSTVDQEDEIIYSHLDDETYALLIEEEARLSRAAWARSMDTCDQVHSEGMSLRTTVMAQQSEISELRAADQRRQTVISELTESRLSEAEAVSRDPKVVKSLKDQYGTELQRSTRDLLGFVQSQSYQKEDGIWHQEGRPTREPRGKASHARTPPSIGVTAVLAARATTRNGDDSHTSGTGVRRNERTIGEFTSNQRFIEMVPTPYSSGGEEWPRIETQTVDFMIGVPEETDKIERYVGGMPDSIYSSVVASKPKTMQEAIEMATDLMDRRINTLAERQTENKRKFEDAPRYNQNQQPNKRQNTGRAYAAGNGDRRPYEGAKPRCPS